MNLLFAALGRRLADYLSTPKPQGSHVATIAPELLAAALHPQTC